MRLVQSFGQGSAEEKALLGGKGANLSEMLQIGIRVPPGFTITTEASRQYTLEGGLSQNLKTNIQKSLQQLEEETGKKLGDPENPLLVSVRSGAAISMPGMMDTVLNLGINALTQKALARKTQDPRFAADSHRRFLQMFGDVVLGVGHECFEERLLLKKQEEGVKEDAEISAKGLEDLIESYQELIEARGKDSLPKDPYEQMLMAIEAVFSSWNLPRARKYREIHGISHDMGTAVNVQAMVFGNGGQNSGTGVLFTRDPMTGEKKPFGDYLLNAQGEDVVAGIRVPKSLEELEHDMPEVAKELSQIEQKLEAHFCDMQDIEFTIEEGVLYILQTRSGKRTAAAALRIAKDLTEEGIITKEQAIMSIEPESLHALLHPTLDPGASREEIARGVAASPGAASGHIVFSADEAVEWSEQGKPVILVRQETSPEDIHGMHVSEGILTASGGRASHAAVVARGMGVPCVAGVRSLMIATDRKSCRVEDKVYQEGDLVTIEGAEGVIYEGALPTVEAEISEDLEILLQWADEHRAMKVYTNADTPEDSQRAREFGAEGIGLCRTEHMFFSEERIRNMREMILSQSPEERERALEKLLPHQVEDFYQIFRVMDGLPVTIRLLDPPLHEFLPQEQGEIRVIAEEMGIPEEELQERVADLHEVNPMLGHRGCRLLLSQPEILQMQAKAIFLALQKTQEQGVKALPEIMIPLVAAAKEFSACKRLIEEVAQEVLGQGKRELYRIGTMIELPRACIRAEEIAKEADFFSFGTNDLTQMTYGFSRDDVASFLPAYKEKGYIGQDPFSEIDHEGVGELVELAVQKARRVKGSGMKISICGEHGGNPPSITFFQKVGLNAISCSPYQVPIARLAAGQAGIGQRRAG